MNWSQVLVRRRGAALLLAGAIALHAHAAPAQGTLPPGDGQQTISVGGVTLSAFTYRPTKCEPKLALLVFHGVSRTAERYRDYAKPLADAACAVIVAPLFDRARFPNALYQHGGVARRGAAVAVGARTVDLIAPLAAWTRAAMGKPALPYILLGHSAGAQFIDRVAAFTPNGATRIIVANPSSWVLPTTDTPIPFGFGGAPATEAALRAYLALPLTVLLGTADLLSRELDMTPEAVAQGPDRYHRGLNAFHAARAAAAQHGWTFAWQLREVPNVGHNASAMFASPGAMEAITAAAARVSGG